MIRLRLVSSLLLAAAGFAPLARAAGDALANGFYTRGVEMAAYMDQGSPVGDPFYIPAPTGALPPRVTLTVTHEDNVFLDPGEKTEGTSVRLVPGVLGLWGRPADNHVYVDYGVSIPVYDSAPDVDDNPAHMLKLGVVYRTGKSQVQGQVGYHRQEDLDVVAGARLAKQDYLADLSLEHRISGKSSLGLVGRAERHDFEADRYLDYDRYYGAGRLYHRATAKSEVFAQGGIGRDDPLRDSDARNGADFYDLSLGVRGKQSPKFHTTGRVGYMWRAYDDPERTDAGDWIAALTAESSPFGLATFRGELYADIRPAIDAHGVDTVDQGGTLSVERRLFIERLRGNASLTAGRVEYSGSPHADENEWVRDGRTDNYWGFSVGVDWWTRQRFSVGLAYSYMRRDGSRGAGAEAEDATSYDYGRWTLRASWNY